MTRRSFVLRAGAAGMAMAAYPFAVEPWWLDVTTTTVPIGHLRHPLRIAHLSDLHASASVPMLLIQRAVQAAIAAQPDLIFVTGDFITSRGDFDPQAYAKVLARLRQAAPAYAVLGNHDGGRWSGGLRGYKDTKIVEKILDQAGIQLLQDRSVLAETATGSLRIVGVRDLWSEVIDSRQAFANVKPREPVVLLAHNPDTKDELGGKRWDLMLSGHTHGGQVLIPFRGAEFAPVRDKRFVAGLKQWEDRQIYVTRGVGSILGVRVACRPEVSILNLTPAAATS